MPTENEQTAFRLELKHLKLTVDPAWPVVPGTAFALLRPSLLPKEVTPAGLAANPPGGANVSIDSAQGQVSATVTGMVREGENGLEVKPLWILPEDKSSLSIDVYPKDAFGKDLDPEALTLEIRTALEAIEFDAAILEGAIQKARETKAPVMGVVLLQGQPAVEGRSGSLKKLFKEASATGAIREDGSLDYRERGGHAVITAGDVIAELVPPGRGTPGKDIFGQEIPAEDGDPARIMSGKNVEQAEGEGGIIVYKATTTGVVLFDGATLSISDLLEIEGDIDLNSGNVNLESGSVLIKGTVTTGAKVNVKDNVIIEGVVENADITAGGDITVSGGVLMDEGARIEAGGNVQAKFFRNATIKAGGDVIAEVDIVNCDIQAGGKVIAVSEKGSISGGNITCVQGLETLELGNESNTPTSVTLTPSIPGLQDPNAGIDEITKNLKLFDKYIGVDDTMNALLLAPEEDKNILNELFKLKRKLTEDLRNQEINRAKVLKEHAEALAAVKIKVHTVARPGVSISIMNRSITLKEPVQASKFHWHAEKGGIAVSGM